MLLAFKLEKLASGISIVRVSLVTYYPHFHPQTPPHPQHALNHHITGTFSEEAICNIKHDTNYLDDFQMIGMRPGTYIFMPKGQ